ncbi:MAG: pirin family protein [Archangium sp.]|nr:pirin family protein [Archangium sp.]
MSDDVVLQQVRLGFPWQTLDPFLFCVHHDDAYPVGNAELGPAASLAGRNMGNDFEGKDGWRMYHGQVVPGFPQHPHRGFETVTVVRRGLIDHSDSLGATARFGRGDAQWLTAGKGVVHSEMFPLLDQQGPNPVELFQIWLNLPRANKMVDPYFSMFWADTIPLVRVPGAEISLVAGQLGDVRAPKPPPHSWASAAESDLAIWTGKLDAEAKWTLPPAKAGTNRMLYFFAGTKLTVGKTVIHRGTGVKLRPDVEVTLENGEGEGEFLILQGRPIGEPVVSYGPFVMNTRQEIEQAFADYQRTQFGGWPWKRDDPVHPRGEGRFAIHADGRREDAK